MARLARVVVPGLPHHVTQRGNRRLPTFFHESDYDSYIELMAESCRKRGVEIWAYCLMPNHVHLIAVPESETSLARAIAEAHRRYTVMINSRENWRGYLWHGRFASFPLDETHLLTAVRYIELNPVRAGLARKPEDYEWSSARAHIEGQDDWLAACKPLFDIVGEDWRTFISEGLTDEDLNALRKHERTGRPLGSRRFVAMLEDSLGRLLRKRKPGPKPKN